MKQKTDIRRLAVLSMLCTIAYLLIGAFPIKIQFLSIGFSDSILAIAGFLYGPLAGFVSVVAVAFLEMLTFSSTGWIGLLMNILSSAFLVCPAAYLYKKNRSLKGAVLGLACGVILTTGAMLLWNWLITPLYMNVPREAVVQMLIPLFLPFNALKATTNAVLALVLYKSVVTVLRKAGLFETSQSVLSKPKFGILIPAGILFVTLLLIALAWSGVI